MKKVIIQKIIYKQQKMTQEIYKKSLQKAKILKQKKFIK